MYKGYLGMNKLEKILSNKLFIFVMFIRLLFFGVFSFGGFYRLFSVYCGVSSFFSGFFRD